MLYLYQSNRLEYLAEMLCAVWGAQPLDDPFATEEVVVQSQGMRRFLSRFAARRLGVSANVRFSLPAGLAWRLMRQTLDNVPEQSPFAPEVMRWRLLALFDSPQFAADDFAAVRAKLEPYLANGALAAYQLAGQLADVFDHYQVYRPQWIEAWRKGHTLPHLHEDQLWQARLWQSLDDGTQTHRVVLWQQLLQQLGNAPLPQRMTVFGIATLAPMYLQLLLHLAQHCDIHIYALNPSMLYWGDVVEAQTILQQAGEPDLSRQGHPLLASLGKQGRDFFDALTQAQISAERDVFDETPASPSLLHTLQYHIQNQILPAEASNTWLSEHRDWLAQQNLVADTPLAQLCADTSIQIHSAHSPLRELHILKDRLLTLLHTHPDWQPHDIAVLTPDIAPYAPFIEAVFGGSADGIALPYSVSDVRLSRRQPLLYALEQALSLLAGRFEAEKLLPLLDNETVQRRFGITLDDLPLLHDTVAQLNIRWGADAEQRAEHGGQYNLFTWQQGLERLILGWVMPENGALWHGVSPWHAAPEQSAVLARFAALVRVLADTRRQWQTPATPAQWAQRLRDLCQALCLADDGDADALSQWEQALANWTTHADSAGFEQAIGSDTAVAHVRRFLGSQSDAGFLRGGITFCSMVPMRSLPFKAVCLLGLNDGQFPRNTSASPFDLIAKHPEKGDRARRDDDRYLFLEAILSAREVLYLSYVGRSVRSNDALAPSVLLYELADSVAALSGVPAGELMDKWVLQHPLQGFSPRYFDGTPRLHGSRSDYAAALNQIPTTAAPFLPDVPDDTPAVAPAAPVPQSRFLRFWRNPPRSYLKQHLDWQAPHSGEEWVSSEPFMPEQPHLLDQAYLHAREHGLPFDELADELGAQSLLPAGRLGTLAQHDFAARAAALDGEILRSPRLPEQNGVLNGAAGALAYRLPHCRQHGQIIAAADFVRSRQAKPSAADQIELLLTHLIYCAVLPDSLPEAQRHTHCISLFASITLPPLPQQQAQDALQQWLAAYHAGQHAPLPFFPRMSLRAAVKFYTDGQDWEKAQAKAAEVYHGGFRGFAQADYPEIKLLYGRDPDAEPPYRLPAFRRLVENLFAPLGECLSALNSEDEK